MAAFLYEGVLLFGLVVAVGLVFGITADQRHGLAHRQGLQISLFVAISAYFIGFWTSKGQTLAMKTWHLQLVSADGQFPSPLQSALRLVLSSLWFFPALVMIYLAQWHSLSQISTAILVWILLYAAMVWLLPHRQFAHDLLAGTRLIDTRNA